MTDSTSSPGGEPVWRWSNASGRSVSYMPERIDAILASQGISDVEGRWFPLAVAEADQRIIDAARELLMAVTADRRPMTPTEVLLAGRKQRACAGDLAGALNARDALDTDGDADA